MTDIGTNVPTDPSGGHAIMPRVTATPDSARTGTSPSYSGTTWAAMIVLAAIGAVALAIAGTAKATKGGGTGFQVVTLVVAIAVLLVCVLGVVKMVGGRIFAPDVPTRWLQLIEVAGACGIGLAAWAIAKSRGRDDLPMLMLVLDLWILSVALRLHRPKSVSRLTGGTR